MIPVNVLLDDIDFDALVELARSRLPAEAKDWTDYNFHDPGMTLIDLAAFIADTQIYSLARHRRDERIAMARLLGIEPRGAVPARGTLYPSERIEGARHVEEGTRLSPFRAAAPRLTVVEHLDLLPLEVDFVVTELPGGRIDHTAANDRPRASFAPFGAPTDPKAALRIRLRGRPGLAGFTLSLGFALETDSTSDPLLGGIGVFFRLADGGGEVPLEVAHDTTEQLQRSGVMLLTPGAYWDARDHHDIVLRPKGAGALLPRLVQIAVNGLPVEQQVSVTKDAFSFGTARPGQTLALTSADLLDQQDREGGVAWRLCDPKPAVWVDAVPWSLGDLEMANPVDQIYSLVEDKDGDSIVVRFGNGINGATLPIESSLRFEATMSRGAAGNIMSELNWTLDGHRLGFTNRGPIEGGRNPLGPKDMLDAARTRLRENRPLATSADIAEAALKLPEAFAVERADVVEDWERGRKRPASSRTRTLVVARKGIAGQRTESSPWLRAIRRRLAPQVDLGERLLVVAPQYREIDIKIRVVTLAGQHPDLIKDAIEKDLRDRLTPSGELGALWPLGRELSIVVIGGWVRRIPGVLRVETLSVSEGGKPITDKVLALKRDELPHLVSLDVGATAAGARP